MNSLQEAFSIPKRVSLSLQTVEAIRNAIEEGLWTDHLPSERRLCGMFQVSRPTVRAAVRQLAKEGLVVVRHGRSTDIVPQPKSAGSSKRRLVAIVTHEPLSLLASASYQGISEMRTHLAENNVASEIYVCPPRSSQAQLRKLGAFIRENKVSSCVLISVGKEIQQWFAERSLPALVLGSCHAGVNLPSLDLDMRSVCRHAAGTFLRKGHRRIALVVPNSGLAGDLASERGFLEAAEQWARPSEIEAIVVRHDGTARNLGMRLDALFNSNRAPTALLVAKPQHVMIVVLYLLTHGISVPGRVSLIARDHDNLFTQVIPPIAHYSLRGDVFNHRLTRLMLQLANQGSLPAEPHLIFPQLFAGGTVGSL
ncbi:putative HTH-type transcriptional regulator YurK [mine drainage metagenome]|uniref:Putative HTH-type transcriptional regulator YurK n=1 Tax=mine drainage metagenome TaxID=410659 RepID=A0A1J5SIJ5_9ZZZZ